MRCWFGLKGIPTPGRIAVGDSVYKNYDPRAKIIKAQCDKVLKVAICPTGLVEALGESELPFKTGAVRIAQQAGVPMVPVYFHYGSYPGRWVTPFSITVQNILRDDRTVLGGLVVRRADPLIDEGLDPELRGQLVALITDPAFESALQVEVSAAAVVREKFEEITRHCIGDVNHEMGGISRCLHQACNFLPTGWPPAFWGCN